MVKMWNWVKITTETALGNYQNGGRFEIWTVQARTEPSTLANRTRLTSKWRTNDDNNSASGIRVSRGAGRTERGRGRRAARAVAAAATVTSGSVSSMGLNWTKGETETRSSIKLQTETAGLGTTPGTQIQVVEVGRVATVLIFVSAD